MGIRRTRLGAAHPGDMELIPSGRCGSRRVRICVVGTCTLEFSIVMDVDMSDLLCGLIRSVCDS